MSNLTARHLTGPRWSAGLLLCVLTFGPSAGASRARSQDVKMDGYPAIGAPAIVTLISAGAEPRTPLRYAVPASYKGRMANSMTASVTMGMGAMTMPTMNMPVMKSTVDLAVTQVAPNGDISFSIGMGGMTAEAAPGTDPSMAAAFQGVDADIKTIRGTATVTSRGVKRSSNIDTSKVTNPQFKQALESIASSLDNMVTPLPEEAVGVGARWEVRQGLAASGTSMFQKAVFEVVSIDGKVVTLKVTGEQTAPPQAMSNPAFPPGTEASLQKATGAISGTMTMRLDDLVPTSVLNSQLDMIMDVSIGGQSQTMSVTTAQTIEVSPAKAGK